MPTENEIVIRLIEYWVAAWVPRSICGIVGALAVYIAVSGLFKSRLNLLAAMLWIIAAGISFCFAFIPGETIRSVIALEYYVRVRVIIASISVLILLVTLESIRHARLKERYAILWIITAFALLVCAMAPRLVDLLRAATGMDYAAAIVAVAFTFLLFVAFDFSISLSRMQEKNTQVTQRIALLQQEIEQLKGADAPDQATDHRQEPSARG
jgi:hypothetical protein